LCNYGANSIGKANRNQIAMHVPRRHHRRLLLPPGWVALGLLLLVGCQGLLTHRRQLRLQNVLGLTMPALKQDTAMNRFLKYHKDYDLPYKTLGELDIARNWRTVEYWGMLLTDSDNRVHVKAAIQAINADVAHEGGVRIRLHEHATYADLVEVLDMMNSCGQRKYFLDIHHQPITLYAITDKPLPVDSIRSLTFSCGTRCYEYHKPTGGPTFEQLWLSCWQQAWRLSMLLFVVLTGLSIYRLAHPRPAAR
jgi:hypothetical protein